jgi:predicted DNA-binding transcriptional regulator YafY
VDTSVVRRADRLFDIIQALRGAKQPLTARALADRLEVAPRTIYRDIATLQARRVPIEGAVGLGYVLRRGYDLPPLMFTDEEVEAIAVAARMVHRLRDKHLHNAAESVLSKIAAELPPDMQKALAEPRVWVSKGDVRRPLVADLAEVRSAIRLSRKLRITYSDGADRRSRRSIRPIAMVYYVDVTLIAAWCELRTDFRHFRVDRIASCVTLDEYFSKDTERHMAEWLEQQAAR